MNARQKGMAELLAEKDLMQKEILDISSERDALVSGRDSMQQKIESLLGEVAEITSATLSAQLIQHSEKDKLSKEMAARLDKMTKQKEEMAQ